MNLQQRLDALNAQTHKVNELRAENERLRSALRQCLDVNGDDATMRRIEMIVQAAPDAAGGVE